MTKTSVSKKKKKNPNKQVVFISTFQRRFMKEYYPVGSCAQQEVTGASRCYAAADNPSQIRERPVYRPPSNTGPRGAGVGRIGRGAAGSGADRSADAASQRRADAPEEERGEKETLEHRMIEPEEGRWFEHCKELTSYTSAGRESIHSQAGMERYEFSSTSRVAGERTHCFSICREDRK